jgi:pilus assembly protein Flp/PilA
MLVFVSYNERVTLVVDREGVTHMLKRRQRGQGLVEYALIIALVAIVVIAILVIMGPQIGNIFSNITHGL